MYRTIDTSTWFDPKIKSLEPDGKLLFVYLFSNSHGHVSGIYYLPIHSIAHETGIKEARVNTLLDTLFELSLVVYDRVSEVVWVKKMFDHQGKGRLNDTAAAKHLGSLHNCRLIKDFLSFYSHRQIPYQYPIEGYSAQEQEQEQNQYQKQDQDQLGEVSPKPSPRARKPKRIPTTATDILNGLPIPPELNTPDGIQATREWLEHKDRIRNQYASKDSFGIELSRWAKLGAERFAAAVRYSIGKEWKGIYEESTNGKAGHQQQLFQPRGVKHGDAIADRL